MGFWDAKKKNKKKHITLQVNDGLAERDEKRTVRVLKVFKGQMTNSSKNAVSSADVFGRLDVLLLKTTLVNST